MNFDFYHPYKYSTSNPAFYGTATSTMQQSLSSNKAVNRKNDQHIKKLEIQIQEKKRAKCLRRMAGEVWEDPSLDAWPDDDYRIFCGDMGNEVTDEVLANAFRKYPSFQKARSVRNKYNGKAKGFGFVSFKKEEDYVKALKEMNGKYVGNRPIKLTPSKWKQRALETGESTVPIESVKLCKRKTMDK